MGSVVVSGSSISIGGSSKDDPSWQKQTVAGVQVSYSPLRDGQRQVHIHIKGGDCMMSLAKGSSSSSSVNGVTARSDGLRLWINNQEVNFSGSSTASAPPAPVKTLQQRYPGVTFTGTGEPSDIPDDAIIAPGAKVDLTGLILSGSIKIGKTAVVSGPAQLTNVQIDGRCSGGMLTNTSIEQGGTVAGGMLTNVSGLDGGTVSAGMITNATIIKGQKVTGGMIDG